jgi:hypothetical protein
VTTRIIELAATKFGTSSNPHCTNTFKAGLNNDIESLPQAFQFLPLMGFGRHASMQRKFSYITRRITELVVQITGR